LDAGVDTEMTRRAADILLVEDDTFEMELTLHAFRKHVPQCLIDVARDGEEALAYLSYTGPYVGRKSAQPRLVILDINLPKKSGIEVLCTIKTDAQICLIPVVMLTSSRDTNDVTESYRCGANGYIVKPHEFSKFDQVIGAVCAYWLQINALPRARDSIAPPLAH
jgi:two-component system response regulator